MTELLWVFGIFFGALLAIFGLAVLDNWIDMRNLTPEERAEVARRNAEHTEPPSRLDELDWRRYERWDRSDD